MKIKKLIINSFRGVKNVEFELNDKINLFTGKNKLGKTTIIDSIMWVLCGETLVYGKQDEDNRNTNDLKDKINVKLEMDNGCTYERLYCDVWKNDEDGNLKYVRTDNKFFINGAKYNQSEFYDFIKQQLKLYTILNCKEFNLLRALIDYNYLSSIDYKVARKFIEQVIRLQSDSDIINDKYFESISNDLRAFNYDTNKCANKYKNEIEKLNLAISNKEALINEYVQKIDEEEILKYNDYIKQKEDIINDNINNNNDFLTLEQLLKENQLNIQSEEENLLKRKNEVEEKKSNLINLGKKIKTEIGNNNEGIFNLKNRNDSLVLNIELLTNQIKNIKNNNFAEIICPKCKTLINANEKKKFEENNKNDIDSIQKLIDEKNEDINGNLFVIKELETKNELLEKDFQEKYNEYKKCDEEINNIENEIKNNSKIAELHSINSELLEKKNKMISDFNTSRIINSNNISIIIKNIEDMINIKNNVKTYQNEVKELKILKAKAENNKLLVAEFEKKKLEITKQKTKEYFPDLNLELIELNEKTGVSKNVCYIKLESVEYKGINDGNRKLIGIIAIENIKKALGLDDLPIIFDKFADIDKDTYLEITKKTNAQIISTLVNNDNEIKLINKYYDEVE